MKYVVPGYLVTFLALGAYGISLAIRLRRGRAMRAHGAEVKGAAHD